MLQPQWGARIIDASVRRVRTTKRNIRRALEATAFDSPRGGAVLAGWRAYFKRTLEPRIFWELSVLRKLGRILSISSK